MNQKFIKYYIAMCKTQKLELQKKKIEMDGSYNTKKNMKKKVRKI